MRARDKEWEECPSPCLDSDVERYNRLLLRQGIFIKYVIQLNWLIKKFL